MKNLWFKISTAFTLLATIIGAIFLFRKGSPNSDTDEIVEDMFQSEKDRIEEEKKEVEQKVYSKEEIEKKYNG